MRRFLSFMRNEVAPSLSPVREFFFPDRFPLIGDILVDDSFSGWNERVPLLFSWFFLNLSES